MKFVASFTTIVFLASLANLAAYADGESTPLDSGSTTTQSAVPVPENAPASSTMPVSSDQTPLSTLTPQPTPQSEPSPHPERTFDAQGRLTSFVSVNGKTTLRFEYDSQNRVSRIHKTEGGQESTIDLNYDTKEATVTSADSIKIYQFRGESGSPTGPVSALPGEITLAGWTFSSGQWASLRGILKSETPLKPLNPEESTRLEFAKRNLVDALDQQIKAVTEKISQFTTQLRQVQEVDLPSNDATKSTVTTLLQNIPASLNQVLLAPEGALSAETRTAVTNFLNALQGILERIPQYYQDRSNDLTNTLSPYLQTMIQIYGRYRSDLVIFRNQAAKKTVIGNDVDLLALLDQIPTFPGDIPPKPAPMGPIPTEVLQLLRDLAPLLTMATRNLTSSQTAAQAALKDLAPIRDLRQASVTAAKEQVARAKKLLALTKPNTDEEMEARKKLRQAEADLANKTALLEGVQTRIQRTQQNLDQIKPALQALKAVPTADKITVTYGMRKARSQVDYSVSKLLKQARGVGVDDPAPLQNVLNSFLNTMIAREGEFIAWLKQQLADLRKSTARATATAKRQKTQLLSQMSAIVDALNQIPGLIPAGDPFSPSCKLKAEDVKASCQQMIDTGVDTALNAYLAFLSDQENRLALILENHKSRLASLKESQARILNHPDGFRQMLHDLLNASSEPPVPVPVEFPSPAIKQLLNTNTGDLGRKMQEELQVPFNAAQEEAQRRNEIAKLYAEDLKAAQEAETRARALLKLAKTEADKQAAQAELAEAEANREAAENAYRQAKTGRDKASADLAQINSTLQIINRVLKPSRS